MHNLQLLHTQFLQFTKQYIPFPSDSQEYDLIVIGGGSGGLACSKEGEEILIKVTVQLFMPGTEHEPHVTVVYKDSGPCKLYI